MTFTPIARPPKELGSKQDIKWRESLTKLLNDIIAYLSSGGGGGGSVDASDYRNHFLLGGM